MIDLRVVIVTSGKSHGLKNTLDSIKNCRESELISELVVAENGRDQHSDTLAMSYAEDLPIRYFHTSTPGKCRALNLALDSMPDDCLVVFADDDIRCCKDWILRYFEISQEYPTGFFFGGATTAKYERPPSEWLKRHLPLSAKGMDLKSSAERAKINYFMGFNWAAFCCDIRRVGCFDEIIGPGAPLCSLGDEVDIQRRLVAACIEPKFVEGATVEHYVPESKCGPKWLIERSRQNGRAIGYIAAKKGPKMLVPKSIGNRLRALWIRVLLIIPHTDRERRLAMRCKLERLNGWREGIRVGSLLNRSTTLKRAVG